MNYLQQIHELASVTFHSGGTAQIVIDIIENAQMELSRDESFDPVERDELGSYVYDINNIMDIIKPELVKEIDVLTKLRDILAAWRDDVEFVNRTLGIPLHRG